jgi:phosphoribosylformylglycinamidine synthase
MSALEILLAESQERMCYEVRPEDVDHVRAIADRYDLGCSVIGEVREGNYVCTFDGETVVDVPAEFLADGAPMNDLPMSAPAESGRDLPDCNLESAFEAVLASPTTASKEWVYRQYDHEVGTRTARRPGDDAAIMAIREAGTGLALSAGAIPAWTDAAPYEGARAVALENATNLAAKGATPHAAVDCLNGGNPEKADVYGGFGAVVDGLADMCRDLSVPVVGGNVSLYNDSVAGPIPPTPTVAMIGVREGYDSPPTGAVGEGTLLEVGARGEGLGGSEYLRRVGGDDRFPALPTDARTTVEAIESVADLDSTLAVHDVSNGGLAVTLAEMVSDAAGVSVAVDGVGALFDETPGRVVVETTDVAAVKTAAADVPVRDLGAATTDPTLRLAVGSESLERSAATIADSRDVIARELD